MEKIGIMLLVIIHLGLLNMLVGAGNKSPFGDLVFSILVIGLYTPLIILGKNMGIEWYVKYFIVTALMIWAVASAFNGIYSRYIQKHYSYDVVDNKPYLLHNIDKEDLLATINTWLINPNVMKGERLYINVRISQAELASILAKIYDSHPRGVTIVPVPVYAPRRKVSEIEWEIVFIKDALENKNYIDINKMHLYDNTSVIVKLEPGVIAFYEKNIDRILKILGDNKLTITKIYPNPSLQNDIIIAKAEYKGFVDWVKKL